MQRKWRLVAAGAKYRKNCFSLYVAKKGKSLGTDKDLQYEAAFQELAEDIIPGIKKGKSVWYGLVVNKVSWNSRQRRNRFRELHQTTSQKSYRKALWRWRSVPPAITSKQTWDCLLKYYKSTRCSECVGGQYTSSWKQRQRLRDSDSWRYFRVASFVKKEIKECTDISMRLLNVRDISTEQIKKSIPGCLYWLIRLLITSDERDYQSLDGSSTCNNLAAERQVISIAQDIIHCSSNSRTKLPKHISLALCVHHLTSSRLLVTLLNKMGHCCSYDEMRGTDASIAAEVLPKA